MAHYIDKDALVAEIERLKDEYLKYSRNKFHAKWSCGTLDNVLSFLDTLEVKEVDINKEISQFIDANFEKATIGHKLSLRRTAKHFFELGLKVSQKEVDLELITSWFDHIAQIADDRMTLTNQRMTDAHALDEIKCLAKNSSEFITKHYKAQKGEKYENR